MRTSARRAFVHADCSKRVARSILRKMVPVPGKYSVGDLVCFKRNQGADTAGTRWSAASRIIGFDVPNINIYEAYGFTLTIHMFFIALKSLHPSLKSPDAIFKSPCTHRDVDIGSSRVLGLVGSWV